MQKINEQQYQEMAPKVLTQLINYNNSSNWKQFLEGKTQGYTMASQTDSVIAKGVTVLQLPFEKVYDFINKQDSFKKLNQNCLQFKILHNNPGKFKITYVQIKTPFPLDNRQTLCIQATKLQKDIYYIAVKSCNYPKQVEPKFVRAKINIAGWILQRQGNRTKVSYLSDIDPMGNIPDLLKNSMASKRAQIVSNLQNIMKKNGY